MNQFGIAPVRQYFMIDVFKKAPTELGIAEDMLGRNDHLEFLIKQGSEYADTTAFLNALDPTGDASARYELFGTFAIVAIGSAKDVVETIEEGVIGMTAPALCFAKGEVPYITIIDWVGEGGMILHRTPE